MEKWKNYRANHVVPPGFKSVPEVFEILGRVIFDPSRWGEDCIEQWTGREHEPVDILTEAERSRRGEILLWMHKLSSAGILKFFMLLPGGAPALVVKERWNCGGEVAEDRFSACALYSGRGNAMQRPSDARGMSEYYGRFDIPIFADDASLTVAAEGISVAPFAEGRSATDDISVHIADSFLARLKTDVSVVAQNQDGSLTMLKSAHTGAPGRPTPWHIVKALFDKRCAADEVCDTKAAEARELDRLFRSDPTNSGLAPLKVTSIENRLIEPYRQYKASRSTQKDTK